MTDEAPFSNKEVLARLKAAMEEERRNMELSEIESARRHARWISKFVKGDDDE